MMAWLYIKLPGGTLKVKPRSHLRWVERAGQVPVLDLGVVILSWWSRSCIERDLAERRTSHRASAVNPGTSPPDKDRL